MTRLSPVLGRPLIEIAPSYPPRTDQPALGEWLIMGSRNFSISGLIEGGGGQTGGSAAWFAANCPLAFPFVLDEPVTAYQLGWVNGGTVTPINWDIGIYDTSWARIVSAGSTAGSGGNAWQFVNIADTLLVAGAYYLVLVGSATTANNARTIAGIGSVASLALSGAQDSATTAFPLPNPLTNMAQAATATLVPEMGIAIRALI